MTDKYLVKNGNKIRGFVYQDSNNEWWYAIGRPSQDNFIAFHCQDLEHGIACVEMPLLIDSR